MVQVNEVLSKFVGTHNFHNFTSGKKYTDPSAKRYIYSFEVRILLRLRFIRTFKEMCFFKVQQAIYEGRLRVRRNKNKRPEFHVASD